MPENLGTFSNLCDDVPEKPGTFSNPGIMGTLLFHQIYVKDA
jgi:hypothetical protein